MKILCPTDFSSGARAAAQVALTLAERAGGAVELLSVVPARTEDVVALATDAAVLEDVVRRDRQAQLEVECRELAAGGVEVSTRLAEGDVETSILTRADAIAADLIVMGAHGRPALERFMLGSAAERTVRRANRPVLIVPPGAGLPARTTNGQGKLHVVVALDGRAASMGAVDFVRTLRRQVVCDVTFLRLYWPPEEYLRLGLTGARDFSGPDPEIVADLSRSLAKEIGDVPGSGGLSLEIQPAWGDPAGAILDFARARECHLVVMGAESRHGLARIAHPQVASRVAHQAVGLPVVFAPPPVEARALTKIPCIFTVLAPTDLSEAGNRAVAFAYGLLAPRGGVVELCHVHERALPSPPYVYDRADGKLSDADRARLSAELRALAPAESYRLGITTHVTVIDGGTAARAILQAAERLTVDSIVLGSHGRGGAYRALLGSVSEEVVRHARRPVLVVPGSTEAS